MWPFGKKDKQIAQAEIAAAEARTMRYEKLIEIDNRANANFDAMVRRSLDLIGPRKHEPPTA